MNPTEEILQECLEAWKYVSRDREHYSEEQIADLWKLIEELEATKKITRPIDPELERAKQQMNAYLDELEFM